MSTQLPRLARRLLRSGKTSQKTAKLLPIRLAAANGRRWHQTNAAAPGLTYKSVQRRTKPRRSARTAQRFDWTDWWVAGRRLGRPDTRSPPIAATPSGEASASLLPAWGALPEDQSG